MKDVESEAAAVKSQGCSPSSGYWLQFSFENLCCDQYLKTVFKLISSLHCLVVALKLMLLSGWGGSLGPGTHLHPDSPRGCVSRNFITITVYGQLVHGRITAPFGNEDFLHVAAIIEAGCIDPALG